jgi:DNA polymerase
MIPADIVFIGEAPGISEDVLGRPFVGPAGKLLDSIISRSVPSHLSCAFTNLVACIPLGEDKKKTAEPAHEDIKACQPRLIEFVRLCKPRLLVLVGQLAKGYIPGQSLFNPVNWLREGNFLEFVDIDHPAYILRMNAAQQGLATQRAQVRIACAIEDANL